MIKAPVGQSCVPTPATFRDPLLRQLGKAVFLKPNIPVDREALLHAVIRDAGYDPENLSQYGPPEEGWFLRGKKKPEGFSRKVTLAVWGLSQLKPQPLIKQTQFGFICLTELGVIHARKLCGRNLTADYLDKRLKETGGTKGDLWKILRKGVSSKLPVSFASGLVDDHIHNCMVKLIARDALRERLLSGVKIPDTLLASYAVRAAYTDIRDWGTNPITREIYGARTERERAKGVVLAPVADTRIIWDLERDPSDPPMDIAADPMDFGGAVSIEETLDFETYMQCVEDMFRWKKDKTQLIHIIDMKIQGFTLAEIADREKISTAKITQIVNRAKNRIRLVQSERDALV